MELFTSATCSPSSTTASTALSFTATSAVSRAPSRSCTSSVRWSAFRWSARRSYISGPPTTRPGWKPSPAIIGCRWNSAEEDAGPCSCRGNDAWHGNTPTASTTSSRAWSRGRPTGSAYRNIPPRTRIHRILAPQRSRFTHYYFYIRDETLGPMVMRVASFFPFQTTYYLNGHSFIEQELEPRGSGSARPTTPSSPSPTSLHCRAAPTS